MLIPKAPLPYVGVTGVMNPQDSLNIARAVPSNTHRQAMIGVLISQKSLLGWANQWPNRYPQLDQVPLLFPQHPSAFNVVHYNTDDPNTLSQQLSQVIQLAGPNLHGFQLNMPWPAPNELQRVIEQYPDLKFILQINREAFDMVKGLSDGIVERLRTDYQGLASYALLDLSAGYGQLLDTAWCLQQLRELQSANLGFGLAVAGGLSPSTLHLVEPLSAEFPDLSIDAEARLRDDRDNLVIETALDYIGQAFAMFGDQ